MQINQNMIFKIDMARYLSRYDFFECKLHKEIRLKIGMLMECKIEFHIFLEP